MRVGIIRGDLPGPILLADLEPVSRYNPSSEPRGQERYISRPVTSVVETALSDASFGAGATLAGGDISGTLPLTINGTNDDLKVKIVSAAAFTTVSIVNAAYATLTALITAVNVALVGTGVTARENVAGNGLSLESDTYGVDSYIENDSVAGGSIGNTALGLADGVVRTMPAAAVFIADCLPVGGPLDVSVVTVKAVGATTNSNALNLIPDARGTVTGVADAMAPSFVETPVALDSFLVGNMADLLSANFNPDSRRMPPLSNGPAISVVEDDGTTTFALTLPTVSSATLDSPTAGDVTIAGTGLGDPERNETFIRFTGNVATVVNQQVLEAAGGTVSNTAIVIPASLIAGAATTTTFVQAQVRQRVSSIIAVS